MLFGSILGSTSRRGVNHMHVHVERLDSSCKVIPSPADRVDWLGSPHLSHKERQPTQTPIVYIYSLSAINRPRLPLPVTILSQSVPLPIYCMSNLLFHPRRSVSSNGRTAAYQISSFKKLKLPMLVRLQQRTPTYLVDARWAGFETGGKVILETLSLGCEPPSGPALGVLVRHARVPRLIRW